MLNPRLFGWLLILSCGVLASVHGWWPDAPDVCLYPYSQNFEINMNNPLLTGYNRSGHSWYQKIEWFQQPLSYVSVKFELEGKSNDPSLDPLDGGFYFDTVFLCAKNLHHGSADILELLKEALGIEGGCPISLGLIDTNPNLFNERKCRNLPLATEYKSADYFKLTLTLVGRDLPWDIITGNILLKKI